MHMTRARKSIHLVIIDFDDIRNPLLNAGQARSTYETGKRLASRGHRVEIVSSRYPGYQDRNELGMEYKHIGLGSNCLRLNNIVFFPAVFLAAKKFKADIILECFTAPISALFTPWATDIPVIAKPTSFEAGRFRQIYHLPFDFIERIGCRYYRYFAAGNATDEEKMRGYNPDISIRLVPEGVSEEYFSIQHKKPQHLLYLGRIDIGQKGLDMLVSAYAKIKDRIGLPLVIAGHGPDDAKLASLIKKHGLEQCVAAVGPAYGEKKYRLLSEAAFVVLPSRREGFCLFALEALAAGLPIVSFDIPGLSWITADCSEKANPFDIGEFALKLLAYALDEKRRFLAGRQASALARDYSWDKVADKMEDFFYEVLSAENKLWKNHQ